MQPAMVSSFGLWFGAYSECIADDIMILAAARTINNRNPLGTAAGYGTTLPLKRRITPSCLSLMTCCTISLCRVGQGKVEMAIVAALSAFSRPISVCHGICLFMSENAGSSIFLMNI